jgi:hypothetical protein
MMPRTAGNGTHPDSRAGLRRHHRGGGRRLPSTSELEGGSARRGAGSAGAGDLRDRVRRPATGGTYNGYPVEAWAERNWPYPPGHDTTSGSAGVRDVNMFNVSVRSSGVRYWACEPDGWQNPFTAPTKFHISPPLYYAQRVDPALEERLRAAGLVEEISRLVQRPSGRLDVAGLLRGSKQWLPRVSFLPSPGGASLDRGAPGTPGVGKSVVKAAASSSVAARSAAWGDQARRSRGWRAGRWLAHVQGRDAQAQGANPGGFSGAARSRGPFGTDQR